jgi:putative tricarboxylic transport membrane protein
MKKYTIAIIVSLLSCFSYSSEINFLIPAGEGGGWDTTAREAGKALVKEGLIDNANFINFPGGGGGRALVELVNNESNHQNTLMVQSTPLILRKLTGVIPMGFRDIRPISLMISEFEVIVVKADSTIMTLEDLVQSAKNNPKGTGIIGGSAKGSLDHIAAALLYKAAGLDIKTIRYAASDGGGDALQKLKDDVGIALVTGYGEVVNELANGSLRALAISSDEPVAGIDIPTFRSQGYDVVFANWRGFFAPNTISEEKANEYKDLLTKLSESKTWAEARGRYGWASFVRQDDALIEFLESQDTDITEILSELEMI